MRELYSTSIYTIAPIGPIGAIVHLYIGVLVRNGNSVFDRTIEHV